MNDRARPEVLGIFQNHNLAYRDDIVVLRAEIQVLKTLETFRFLLSNKKGHTCSNFYAKVLSKYEAFSMLKILVKLIRNQFLSCSNL